MGFSRQEYWSVLPCQGNLPDPGTEPASLLFPALAGTGSLTLTPPGKPYFVTQDEPNPVWLRFTQQLVGMLDSQWLCWD